MDSKNKNKNNDKNNDKDDDSLYAYLLQRLLLLFFLLVLQLLLPSQPFRPAPRLLRRMRAAGLAAAGGDCRRFPRSWASRTSALCVLFGGFMASVF